MRIAYDFQTFFLQPFGGISRYFSRLAYGIHQIGNQVQVFSPIHQNNYLKLLSCVAPNGHYMESFPPRFRPYIGLYNYAASCIQIAKWKPEVLHETYYAKLGYGHIKGCRKIITVYDMIHEIYPNDFPNSDHTSKLKRSAVARADHIICISESTKRDLVRLFDVSERKVSVIHLGFDPFIDASHYLQQPTLTKRPYLLYVGHRGGYKNFKGFLRAVARSPRLLADFEVIAFGGGKFSTAEFDFSEALGFSAHQVRHIAGDDNLLGSYYRAASALVYPSLYEGFGLPPLEAMSCGCPVVSSNTSSMPEIIGDAAEYFDPSDSQDICRAIEIVVYSDSRALTLKEAGKKRLSNYSWERCSQETLEAYQTIL